MILRIATGDENYSPPLEGRCERIGRVTWRAIAPEVLAP